MNAFQCYLVLVVVNVLLGLGPAYGQPERAGNGPGTSKSVSPQPSSSRDESQPVDVPVPSARAMEFYRSGNALWVFNRAWVILLTGALAFSGASARIRTLAQRMGRNW